MRETNDVTLGNAIVFSFWATLVLGAPVFQISREFLLARRPTYREYDHVLVELSGGVPSLCPSQ